MCTQWITWLRLWLVETKLFIEILHNQFIFTYQKKNFADSLYDLASETRLETFPPALIVADLALAADLSPRDFLRTASATDLIDLTSMDSETRTGEQANKEFLQDPNPMVTILSYEGKAL